MSARWHALAVHARSEASAAAELSAKVDEVFLPARVERRAWSDRVRRVEVPLFPGYVFARLALCAERRVALLRCKGVIDVVGRLPGDAAIARAIPSHEIEALQALVRAERALDPVERLVPGTPVTVAAGPLRGVCGVVQRGPDGQRRIVVQVGLLGRGVRAVLGSEDVVEALERVGVG